MKAYIEQIEVGHDKHSWKLGSLEVILHKTSDKLDISNSTIVNAGILSLAWYGLSFLKNYKQIGVFKVKRPHNFKERTWVDVRLRKGKIVSVKPLNNSVGIMHITGEIV